MEISSSYLPANIDMPIKGIWYIIDTTNNYKVTLPFQLYYASTVWKSVQFDYWTANASRHVYMYVEYTKTTDEGSV